MIYRFKPPTDLGHDAIRIRKKRDGIITLAHDESLPAEATEFNDPFYKEGDLYSYQLFQDNCELFAAEFTEIEFEAQATFCFKDLFHPFELEACKIPEGSLAAIVHQNLNSDSWWESTRVWLVKIENQGFTLSDDMFWPKGQNPFDYSSIGKFDLYIMPTQLYNFVSYLSLRLEKPFYNFPEELPKGYSMEELIKFTEAAVGIFNQEQPQTYFHFAFSSTLNSNSIPSDNKALIVDLASVEALMAMVINWIELDVAYSDGGVDVDLSKHDKYMSMLDNIKGELADKLVKAKSSYRGRGFYLGDYPSFRHPWSTVRVGTSEAPFLHFRAGLG